MQTPLKKGETYFTWGPPKGGKFTVLLSFQRVPIWDFRVLQLYAGVEAPLVSQLKDYLAENPSVTPTALPAKVNKGYN